MSDNGEEKENMSFMAIACVAVFMGLFVYAIWLEEFGHSNEYIDYIFSEGRFRKALGVVAAFFAVYFTYKIEKEKKDIAKEIEKLSIDGPQEIRDLLNQVLVGITKEEVEKMIKGYREAKGSTRLFKIFLEQMLADKR